MAVVMLASVGSAAKVEKDISVGQARSFDGTLSVMTYNVKGLPWPVAGDRTAAFGTIADRLRALRTQARNPNIVVMQESFTAEAQAIGPAAGYRYIANGPSADDLDPAAMTSSDRRFVSGALWWKGETQGKYVGSGLQILSDYPIIAVRRMTYPAFACAGYDCLANKGALLATIAIPGISTPVDVVTTHLNSRHASGVPDARSLYAYRRQVGALSKFIHDAHDPHHPLIVAGDFNVGLATPRRAALLAEVRSKWCADGGMRDALNDARQKRIPLSQDATLALRRARDWQFFSSGDGAILALQAIDVPFGQEPAGGMLSDHIGYTALFRLTPASRPDMLPAAAITTSVPPKV